MESRYLLPHWLKSIGWIMFFPGLVLGIFSLFYNVEYDFLEGKVFTLFTGSGLDFKNEAGIRQYFIFVHGNYTNTLVGLFFLVALLLIAFSSEKEEDEFISSIRLNSLVWATYANYLVLIIGFLFFFGFEFLYVMIFNMYTTLIIFIIRFYFLMSRAKVSRNEK
ncbi:MAG: hypothetical protein IPL08_09085 [Saprospiraceae bacterium]|nr:hypothetical protein [Saprospiraceae bacterium]MBL0101690.1 hypothetical protein [Saprospiraceae bacterium]